MEKEKQQTMREQRLEHWEPASEAEASVSKGPYGGDRGEAEERPIKSRNIRLFRGLFAFLHHLGSDLYANFSASKLIWWRLWGSQTDI